MQGLKWKSLENVGTKNDFLPLKYVDLTVIQDIYIVKDDTYMQYITLSKKKKKVIHKIFYFQIH